MHTKKITPTLIDDINHILIKASIMAVELYHDYVCNDKDINIQKKSDESPVTQADQQLHHFISKKLAELTPNIPCLSEESEKELTDRQSIATLWLLDPIDGTRAFIKKTGEFTVNLALIHNEVAIASWLTVPMQAELYCCFKENPLMQNIKKYDPDTIYALSFMEQVSDYDEEFFLQNNSMTSLTDTLTKVPVNTSSLKVLHTQNVQSVMRVGLSRSANINDYTHFLDGLKNTYNCDIELVQASSAYKFVQMLRNEIDVYVRAYPTCEWDTASGQAMIEVCGGQLINFRGNAFLYNQRDTLLNGGFVCFKNTVDQTLILKACCNLIEKN